MCCRRRGRCCRAGRYLTHDAVGTSANYLGRSGLHGGWNYITRVECTTRQLGLSKWVCHLSTASLPFFCQIQTIQNAAEEVRSVFVPSNLRWAVHIKILSSETTPSNNPQSRKFSNSCVVIQVMHWWNPPNQLRTLHSGHCTGSVCLAFLCHCIYYLLDGFHKNLLDFQVSPK